VHFATVPRNKSDVGGPGPSGQVPVQLVEFEDQSGLGPHQIEVEETSYPTHLAHSRRVVPWGL
jgi:hypothetical protein